MDQVAKGSLFAGMRFFPPGVQKRHLRPYESEIFVLLQFRHHVVHYLTGDVVEIVFEGFQPSRVVMGMRNYYDLNKNEMVGHNCTKKCVT
jgi:hypothetical protein